MDGLWEGGTLCPHCYSLNTAPERSPLRKDLEHRDWHCRQCGRTFRGKVHT